MASRAPRAAHAFVPVEAKLRAPLLSDELVVRRGIVERLVQSADVPVVVVTGPAGYGKTVAVSQWGAADERPFGWVSLDDGDAEPQALVAYLVRALERIAVVKARAIGAETSDADSLMTVALPRLCTALSRCGTPFVLVVDGTDAVTTPEFYVVIAAIVENLPPGSQLVLIGRAAPPLDWTALRAAGRVVEIGAPELRLTQGEASALADMAGVPLPRTAVDQLLDATEGWAAGLYLAVVGMRDAGGLPNLDVGRIGAETLIVDYVRDELLETLRPADRDFLIRTSILAALSAQLCDATLDRSGSGAALKRLARENIVVPLDDRAGWFRVHHTIGAALEAELSRQEPHLLKPLHSRASQWHEGNGDMTEAIRHAVAAGDADRSARLIWHVTPKFLGDGHIGLLEDWLDTFSRQQVLSHAKMALTAAWCALTRGAPADHWISAAERGRYDAARPGESASVAAAVTLLHAILARNGVVQMGADARLAQSLRAEDDEWYAAAMFIEAVSTYLTRGAADARGEFERVQEAAAAAGDNVTRAATLGELALISIADDDWDTARAHIDRAHSVIHQFELDGMSLLLAVQCTEALLAARARRAKDAERLVSQCIRGLARSVEMPPWLGVQCREILARGRLSLGDAAGTRTLLSEAQTLLRSVPHARVLQEALAAVWADVEQLPIDLGTGASALTTAELRVLQLLPTYLSFEEIGAHLFVSRNTVKTQAIAAYRKLGVTSRAQAVERALALGLIGQ